MGHLTKLIIGTAQFGLNYGINNTLGKINRESIQNVLNYSVENNILYLDTANQYGDAQVNIGEINGGRFNIISKFPKVDSVGELNSEFQSTLKALRLDKIYAYLAHSADNLVQNPEIWDNLLKFKYHNKIEKIGFSLYNTTQLEKLLKMNIIPDIVQIPFSLLDRKFEPFFGELKTFGIEIHIRSVFLQGLYFIDPNNLPVNLIGLSSDLLSINNICNKYNTDINLLALNYAYFHPYVDKVVIGIDSLDHLKKNCDFLKFGALNSEILNEVNRINVKEIELLNPTNW